MLGARSPRKDFRGTVTLPVYMRTWNKQDNTPLGLWHWEGGLAAEGWVVDPQHQTPL